MPRHRSTTKLSLNGKAEQVPAGILASLLFELQRYGIELKRREHKERVRRPLQLSGGQQFTGVRDLHGAPPKSAMRNTRPRPYLGV